MLDDEGERLSDSWEMKEKKIDRKKGSKAALEKYLDPVRANPNSP